MKQENHRAFTTDVPTFRDELSYGWTIAVACLWTAIAVSVGALIGWAFAPHAGGGVFLHAAGLAIGGLAASGVVLTLIRQRMARARRKRDSTLHSWKEVQQLFLDNMPQGVFWKDRDCVYLGCNQMFAEMAGFAKPAELVGLTDYDLPWPADQTEFFRKVDRQVMDRDAPQLNVIEPLTDSDGSPHWHQVNKVPLHDLDGDVVGVLGTYQDITDYKLLEERMNQAEKLRSIGQLAGGVAHDFNNMLTGIMGAAELLSMRLGEVNEEVAGNIRVILDTSQRAGELTQQLLAFSRKAKTQTVPVDINAAVTQATSILKHSLDRRIDLEVDLSRSPVVVNGDPAQLQNAVLNLAVNARDAMPEGGKLLVATARVVLSEEFCAGQSVRLAAGEYVEVTVMDTGVGMPQDVLDHVFEPFFTTKGVGMGTGLGLAAVYGTVKDHHGLCLVQSEVGKGTVFKVYLPFSEEEVRVEEEAPVAPTFGQNRVLLVDDEEIIRLTVRSMLEQVGYEVTLAENGLRGVDAYREAFEAGERFDLVILDLVMPVMKGHDAFHAIRGIDREAKVLIASGFSLGGDVHELLDCGALGFIQKPYQFRRLASAVAEGIRGRPVQVGLSSDHV